MSFGNIHTELVHFGIADSVINLGQWLDALEASPETIRRAVGLHARQKDKNSTMAFLGVHKVVTKHLVNIRPEAGVADTKARINSHDRSLVIAPQSSIECGTMFLVEFCSWDENVLHFVVALVAGLDDVFENLLLVRKLLGRKVLQLDHLLVEIVDELVGDELSTGAGRIGGIRNIQKQEFGEFPLVLNIGRIHVRAITCIVHHNVSAELVTVLEEIGIDSKIFNVVFGDVCLVAAGSDGNTWDGWGILHHLSRGTRSSIRSRGAFQRSHENSLALLQKFNNLVGVEKRRGRIDNGFWIDICTLFCDQGWSLGGNRIGILEDFVGFEKEIFNLHSVSITDTARLNDALLLVHTWVQRLVEIIIVAFGEHLRSHGTEERITGSCLVVVVLEENLLVPMEPWHDLHVHGGFRFGSLLGFGLGFVYVFGCCFDLGYGFGCGCGLGCGLGFVVLLRRCVLLLGTDSAFLRRKMFRFVSGTGNCEQIALIEKNDRDGVIWS